ncbi:outer membrane lipoprotein-sorting protein [Paraburkholderia bonniea]|uniref:outer membrane lipoprotein-sorting protein n=1 Tax=Paraburkholderia bonniea TaxID=2152891 RepID=UPI001FE8C543|nr:outer membrane lipoprotein-sorting protein [Paraburkholderia bonniea]WJF91529.1 outer membrane lipoprotein-sorting protein [Paraburkholderia bonniea]WJF94848.1 outer membrane lipoprotein-sorting protein [Paraburkholderia bonniea]
MNPFFHAAMRTDADAGAASSRLCCNLAQRARRLLAGLCAALALTRPDALALAATTAPTAPVAALSAQQLLAASDACRNPAKPFSLVTTLLEYRHGVASATEVLSVYSSADPASGRFRSLVRFDAPARDANKLLLKNGNDLWFYDPASQASVRISPRQRLLGQAANGDVVTSNLAQDYDATLADDEDITDGEHQPRHCNKLTLLARSPEVTYHAIDLWLDALSHQPVKARFYAASGSLLKTAYYRHFQPALGSQRASETVIIDGLDPSWVTVMRYSRYAWRAIPDEWFQRAWLPHFQPD